jgi:hypothetical protein
MRTEHFGWTKVLEAVGHKKNKPVRKRNISHQNLSSLVWEWLEEEMWTTDAAYTDETV